MGIQSSFVVSWADGVDRRIDVTATKEVLVGGWPHFDFITVETSTTRAEVFQVSELVILGTPIRPLRQSSP